MRLPLAICLLLGWAWVLGSTWTVLTPVPETNEFRQTISRLTWPPQVPSTGDEAVRYAVALEVAAGRGLQVPEVLRDAPGTVALPGATSSAAPRYEPRFTPLYGLLLGGLAKLVQMQTGADTDALPPLITYRTLALVPNLLAMTLLVWFFGQSIALRGLKDQRWWSLAIPVLLLSPLALRLTYLNEYALGAALCWTALALLNTALFRVAKEQPAVRWAAGAGAVLMLAAGFVPLALAAVVGFGGVLLAEKDSALRKLGTAWALGALPVAVLLVISHMWGFNKLLPLLHLHEPAMGASIRYLLANLIGLNGLLWMFPPAAVGLVLLISRIIRTQELEGAQKVDPFRAGQGAFHWGAYWTVLAAIGLAVVDGAFGYGVPAASGGSKPILGILLPYMGEQIRLTYVRFHYGGDAWIVFLPLLVYYCAFAFREPVLAAWRPWYHNGVRIGLLVWLIGTAQPAGGVVCPFLEAAWTWSVGVASYFPAGRLS